ncbi:hypothetical protein SeMB42_g05132 [Synchytrium endobioticum]|nr:hypothetical protein SeMB42_g05132 [Synchytrium endobioticum]
MEIGASISLQMSPKRKRAAVQDSAPATPPSLPSEEYNMGRNNEGEEDEHLPASKQSRLYLHQEPTASPGTPTEKIYICTFPDCHKAFKKRNKLLAHEKNHSEERAYVCSFPGCNKAFRRPDHLKAHAPAHATDIEDQKPYSCTRAGCHARFRLKHQLTRHDATHETPKPFKCTVDECTETFAKREQLRRHVAAHAGLKPFVCTFEGCTKSFDSSYKLNRHTQSHESKMYRCDQCSATLTKWSSLQKHVKQDHTIKCDICDKTFTRPDALTRHYGTHDPNREIFPCTWHGCDRTFATDKIRKVHIKSSHEQVRPFKCNVDGCDAFFAFKRLLERHMRAHDRPNGIRKRKKSLADDGCKRSLAEAITGALPRPARVFPCSIAECTYTFAQEQDVEAHIMAVHPLYRRQAKMS